MASDTAVGIAIDRWLGYISSACILIGSIALVVLLIIFGWLVFGRYVLNVTPTWVEQMALLLVCYITFLGAAAGIHDDTHLGVTFFRNALHSPWSDLVRIVSDLALAVFGVFMLISCFELMKFGWSTKLPMLGLPEGMRTLPAVICGGLMILFSGARTVAGIRRLFIIRSESNTSGTPD